MRLVFACLASLLVITTTRAQQPLDVVFQQTVNPFPKQYCVSCHNPDQQEGDLNLRDEAELADVVKNFRHWMVVADRLEAADMPPEEADEQPSAKDREEILRWIAAVREAEARRTSGDPGIVLARRLSNAEYDYTIRDLTGVDLRPTKTFPIDPANEAGFDNTGESLTMSPALVRKYLDAARWVSEHLVLTPSGFEFASHRVMTDTDRDKFCVNRIIDFYQRQPTDYADYFWALWRFQNREALGLSLASLQDLARQQRLSPKYLQALWSLLQEEPQPIGPLAALQAMWRDLPTGGSAAEQAVAKQQCQAMRDWIVALREKLVPPVENLTTPEVHNGSQPLVLWKNRQYVANRRRCVDPLPELADFGLPADSPTASFLVEPSGASQRAVYRQSFEAFCDLFPDAFYISERARVYLDPKKEKKLTGRYLSAGFHSQMGYFRDDAPLYDLMLDNSQRRELDRLWLELDFVASAPMRQYAGFIWFDRTDSRFMRDRVFDRFRAEDKDCTSETKLRALAAAYIGKAKRVGGNPEAIEALQHYFDQMSTTFRNLEKLHAASEPVHLQALVEFTQRAFRRPLLPEEQDGVRRFYDRLRDEDGLSHDEAIRDTIVWVLMSPHFCYRVDLPSQEWEDSGADALVKQNAVQPLDDVALANRLSYFLWSSMPDETLMELAIAGRLQQPDVLVQQTRRMLRDSRARGLATEFAGNWLDFRRFEQHNGVDRGRFPQFSDELRQAMFEEPIRFLLDVMQRDGSVLDLLYADHTFVNPVLAEHYGASRPMTTGSSEQWQRWELAGSEGRGGLLPMAVFLTVNSPGLRTSPVKRGNWLVQRVLGETIPATPAAVPELPSDEAKLGELSLREVLARHRADASCASCHERIDSFGLVFEGYGPVGELRRKDLGGRAIDDTAEFPDESQARGLDGLRDYVRQHREDDFVENLCRKLLAYGLGRTLLLSDDACVADMQSRLAAEDYRFGSLIEVIVTSPAFRHKRVLTELD